MTTVRRGFLERVQRLTAQEAFVVIVPALFVGILTMFGPSIISDGDPYWHLGAGEWMLQHRLIPATDPFSYTFPGAPWAVHEWFSEVLMALAYRIGGLSGFYLLFGLVVAVTSSLLAMQLLEFLPPFAALVMLQFTVANIAETMVGRPQYLVLPILILWVGELLRAQREQRAPRWPFAALIALWANLHGSFVLGMALLPFFAVEAAIAAKQEWFRAIRSWGLFFIGAVVASLATPNGVYGLLQPVTLLSNPGVLLVAEWRSSTFDTLGTFEICLLAALFICLMRGVRVPVIRLVLLLGLLHQALQHRRYGLIVIVIGSMLLAEPIAKVLKSGRTAENGTARTSPAVQIMGAAGLVLLLAASSVRLAVSKPLADDSMTPYTAVAHVPKAIVTKPVFNDYALGGYLVLTGLRPYIDGRAFDVYSDAFVRNYFKLSEGDAAALAADLSKYGVVWTLLKPQDRANLLLDSMPEWRVLYKDDFAVIHIRRETN